MIEGLRILPFWQDVTVDPTHSYSDCGKCMRNYDPTQRRAMQCGYLPPVEAVGATRVQGWPVPDSDHRTSMCPTYLTSLPEVTETVEAYPQWKERTLTEWLGEPPTPELLYCLGVLANAIGEFEAHKMRVARERGGA